MSRIARRSRERTDSLTALGTAVAVEVDMADVELAPGEPDDLIEVGGVAVVGVSSGGEASMHSS